MNVGNDDADDADANTDVDYNYINTYLIIAISRNTFRDKVL